jgi:hypothetical protein
VLSAWQSGAACFEARSSCAEESQLQAEYKHLRTLNASSLMSSLKIAPRTSISRLCPQCVVYMIQTHKYCSMPVNFVGWSGISSSYMPLATLDLLRCSDACQELETYPHNTTVHFANALQCCAQYRPAGLMTWHRHARSKQDNLPGIAVIENCRLCNALMWPAAVLLLAVVSLWLRSSAHERTSTFTKRYRFV